jgi:hypothetical protein
MAARGYVFCYYQSPVSSFLLPTTITSEATDNASYQRYHDEPISVFKAACEQFRASLSESQRQLFKEYPDANSMLEAIRIQAETHPTHRTMLTRCCKRIAALSIKMEPYFDVINIFVSSHPEFAAIVWGALRLVFVVRILLKPTHPRPARLYPFSNLKPS